MFILRMRGLFLHLYVVDASYIQQFGDCSISESQSNPSLLAEDCGEGCPFMSYIGPSWVDVCDVPAVAWRT